MKNKIIALSLSILLMISSLAGAQSITGISNTTPVSSDQALYMARLSPEQYIVTPGDIYKLSYSVNEIEKELDLFINNNYEINLLFMGSYIVKDLSYFELQQKINSIISGYYSNSLSILQLTHVGIFTVKITGEVKNAALVSVNSLTPLSSIIADQLSSYSSLRDVEVRSADGTTHYYDLFTAYTLGDEEENTLLKPGDEIIVHPFQRAVNVQGEVKNPGLFQLLEGENLSDVINNYCGGFALSAEKTKIAIIRIDTNDPAGETIYINSEETDLSSVEIKNGDIITIPSRLLARPFVFFEGALGLAATNSSELSTRIPHQFSPGESLYTALLSQKDNLTPLSDLEHSYIISTDGTKTDIDLAEVLYNRSSEGDRELVEGDSIVIPLIRSQVYIGGAVNAPGFFPYINGKTWEDYIMMAGGFNTTTHIGTKVIITDNNALRKDQMATIEAEDIIFAPENHPLYLLFGKYNFIFSSLSTIIDATSTGITLTETIIDLFK